MSRSKRVFFLEGYVSTQDHGFCYLGSKDGINSHDFELSISGVVLYSNDERYLW